MTVVAILGSGFGLYGYLPAVIFSGAKHIALPERYKDKFDRRSELSKFSGCIQWLPDEISTLSSADTVVLALRPDIQAKWISRCLDLPNVQSLLLEKPLAPTPFEAISIFNALVSSGKVFRIGYVFQFTSWSRVLKTMLTSSAPGKAGKLCITWHFLAHHFLHKTPGWKQYQAHGGGAIRFYGIHLIALLANLGYSTVINSQTFGSNTEEIHKWVATFSGEGLPVCEVILDTKSTESLFQIECKSVETNIFSVKQEDPFDNAPDELWTHGLDKRICPLKDLYQSLTLDSSSTYKWYRDTLLLWQSIENISHFQLKLT